MSTSILRITPSNPLFIPPENARSSALNYLKTRFRKGKQIEERISEKIIFIDQGHNISEPSCPLCSSVLEIEWFAETVDSSYKEDFVNLDYPSPCCKKLINLNELLWEFPCAFGKYYLEVWDIERMLSEHEIKVLKAKLASSLKIIIARV
ncbi:MAG: hypothetical protein R8P61_08745 [Bacteroidia bacterium]|nr:hypothetical protein [Bacteroidia bacterium]